MCGAFEACAVARDDARARLVARAGGPAVAAAAAAAGYSAPCDACGLLGVSAHEALVGLLCGAPDDAACASGGARAYERALDHARHEYAFIGLIEHAELSLAALGRLLPRFFGADAHSEEWTRPLLRQRRNNSTRHGEDTASRDLDGLSAEATAALLTAPENRYELALYDAIALRFWAQLEELGIHPS